MSAAIHPVTREVRPLALADALAAWSLRKGMAPELARALALAAHAEADGHACVRLAELGDDQPAFDLDALRQHAWVGDGTAVTPAVLTAHGDFFLWRNWRHEQRVSASLLQRIGNAQTLADSLWQADLDQLYAGMDVNHSAGQRLATARALGKRLFVLSGGPGTGKTSTVLRMLLLQQRVAAARGLPTPSVALAAPTGKAAQRLSQALRDGKARLQQSLANQAGDWSGALAAIPEGAQTLHRLLGALPAEDRFRYGGEQPLPYDIVVVDEASMVDLASMRALLDALADTATLLLVGDPDQLVSVSAGSVLADIVAASAQGGGFEQHTAQLTHVWRTGSELALAYAAARRGDADELRRCLQHIEACGIHAINDPRMLAARVQQWLARPAWKSLHDACARVDDPAAAFVALRRQQLLTALRAGPFGAESVNAAMDTHWRRANGGAQWYPGRPVLIRNNDYARRLFNGDVGVAVGRGNALRIAFETVDTSGQPSLRLLQPRELPDFDLAYAITVHQSQGSEYGHVAVLLPPEADNRILSRQLLYTGISRARNSVEIWASAASLDAALGRVSLRAGGLRQALTCRTLASNAPDRAPW